MRHVPVPPSQEPRPRVSVVWGWLREAGVPRWRRPLELVRGYWLDALWRLSVRGQQMPVEFDPSRSLLWIDGRCFSRAFFRAFRAGGVYRIDSTDEDVTVTFLGDTLDEAWRDARMEELDRVLAEATINAGGER